MGRALSFFLFIAIFPAFSQVGPKVWQDHLSLNRCISVTKLGSRIYAANSVGVVWFDESELNSQSLTKINGLNDVGVKLLRTNPHNNKLMVMYENCNIDVIDANQNISNYADFKLKILNGKKSINEAFFYKQYAYLACGFGIVVFDTDKMEVKDTYVIGPNGSDLEVYQVAMNDSLIFAATPNGMYQSNFKTKDLSNFNNWKMVGALPAGPYIGVVAADGKVLAGYSPRMTNLTLTMQDTLFILKNNTWSKYDTTGYTLYKMCLARDTMISYVDDYGLKVRNVNTGVASNYITSFNGKVDFKIADAYFGKDHLSNTAYWVADLKYGLYQTYSYYPFYEQYPVRRAGVNQALINSIDIYNGKVAISPSRPDDGGGSSYIDQGLNVLKDGEWSYIEAPDPTNGSRILDINSVLIDRKDPTHMWAGSWFNGLLEYKNNKLVAAYNPTNTPSMSEVNPGSPRCSGLAMDADGNLWFANSDVSNYISVRKKNGIFQTYDFGTGRFTRKILVDKNNMVWALHEREGGITVLKHNNFGVPNVKLLTKDVNNGNIQSNSAFSIAEDKDGKIWIGTSAGVVVFYNPASIFNSSSFDAQPIKIVQDGNVELLLSKEVVTTIAVDGANNKWMGTQTGGVYCFSPDGLTELYHFTKDNSPLYSNFVMDLNYDETTGDMYFGTDIGLQSFRSPILEGEAQYSQVVAYPNPVRPKYQGSVYVRGLVDNSIVKIADVSGNIVWETKSHGGQIEWNVTTFAGNRVTPGVYIVYASSTDAEQKAVTKILVVN